MTIGNHIIPNNTILLNNLYIDLYLLSTPRLKTSYQLIQFIREEDTIFGAKFERLKYGTMIS